MEQTQVILEDIQFSLSRPYAFLYNLQFLHSNNQGNRIKI